MKTINLVAGIESVSLSELAELIAYARYPGEDACSKDLYELALEAINTEVQDAADGGALKVTNPLTGAPLSPLTKPVDPIDALFRMRKEPEPKYGVVSIEELRRYMALRGIAVEVDSPSTAARTDTESPAERRADSASTAPVVAESASVVIHSTKARRDALTPVIELAQKECRNPQDTAEVWAVLLVLAEKKHAPLRGATEDGLQYLKGGVAAIFNRDALRKRLYR